MFLSCSWFRIFPDCVSQTTASSKQTSKVLTLESFHLPRQTVLISCSHDMDELVECNYVAVNSFMPF